MIRKNRRGRWIAGVGWLTVAACGSEPIAPLRIEIPAEFVLDRTSQLAAIVTQSADYSSGAVSLVSFNGASMATMKSITTVHSDAIGRFQDRQLLVTNRLGADNIEFIDLPAVGAAERFLTIRQLALATPEQPLNLQDVVLIDTTKAYVISAQGDEVIVFNPTTGVRATPIDLSPFTRPHSAAKAASLVRAGDQVLVALQNLDETFSPSGDSRVVVIDVAADTVVDTDPHEAGVQAIELELQNPFARIILNSSETEVLVASTGSFFGDPDGGIEAIDLSDYSTRVAISEETVGGNLNWIGLMPDGNTGYAVISKADFTNAIVRLDTQDDLWTAVVTSGALASIDAIGANPAIDAQGRLWIPDRKFDQHGIRVFSGDTEDEVTDGAVDVGLPPADIVLLQ